MSQAYADLARAADLRRAGDHVAARDMLLAAATANPDGARVHDAATYERALTLGLAVPDTKGDPGIQSYERAIRFYADQPDRVWAGDGTEG